MRRTDPLAKLWRAIGVGILGAVWLCLGCTDDERATNAPPSASSGAAATDTTALVFPDPELEGAVWAALSAEGLRFTVADGDSLTELSAPDLGIASVEGIGQLSGLVSLNLSGNALTELSPLRSLVHLRHLDLAENQVGPLGPLSGLAGLTELNLSGNRVTDLWPLSSLLSLVWLDLGDNRLIDATPLAGLTRLQTLYLDHTWIEYLSPLATLTSLRFVALQEDELLDLSPLLGLDSLRIVEVTATTPDSTTLERLRRKGVEVRLFPTVTGSGG
jgi:Leucine-rich repeat (LRR) protein